MAQADFAAVVLDVHTSSLPSNLGSLNGNGGSVMRFNTFLTGGSWAAGQDTPNSTVPRLKHVHVTDV